MPTVTIGNNTGNTHAGTDDAQLRQLEATTNFGSEITIAVAKFGAGDHTHGVIKFSGLTSIVAPVTVSAATLRLWLEDTGGDITPRAHDIRRLLRNWVEAEATWNICSTGNNWGTAGGINDTSDRVSAASGTGSFATTGAYISITGAGLITDVQDIINGSVSNFGWHLDRQGGGEDGEFRIFTSSEGADGQRPVLDVTYEAAGAVPQFFRKRILV
jgi:hypothetical protein